ncbi:MAG: hypothetical protein WA584_02395 [Pyrinomonadaceae bacterium]
MLNAAESESLLSKLCIELGFCLPPDDVDDFTNAVISAKGLDPQNMSRHLYGQVRAKVAEAFQNHLENEDFFDS